MDPATRATPPEGATATLDASFLALAATLNELVSVHDPGGRCLFASETARELLGAEAADLVGIDWRELVPVEDGNPFAAEEPTQMSHRLLCPDGPPLAAETTVIPVEEEGEVVHLLCVTRPLVAGGGELPDSPRDRLTGLPAWDGLVDRLGGLLAEAEISVAAIVVDLDDLPAVRDEFGADAGDRMLAESARRVQAMLRPTDMLGRLEGDRLCALCVGVKDYKAAVRIAERVRAVVARALPFKPVKVTASVGAAMGSPGGDPATVLRLAAGAAREVQRRGGNAAELRGSGDGAPGRR
jgi:diguanylate cyclase (GGDEF)-like protein